METTTTTTLTADSIAIEEIPENALRILMAAVQLFAEKGYAATSVREIVQQANVTNPMLYYYFDSKEGLFRFLTEFMHAEFSRSLMTAMQPGEPLRRTLVAVVDIHLRGLRDSPEALRFVYSILFGPKGSTPEHRIHESHEAIVEALEQRFVEATERGEFTPSPGLDCRWAALTLLGIANSHIMRIVTEIDALSDEESTALIEREASTEAAERLVTFFLTGAGDISS